MLSSNKNTQAKEESMQLWRDAYEQLAKSNAELVREFEAILFKRESKATRVLDLSFA